MATTPASVTAQESRQIVPEELSPVEERITERLGVVERGLEDVRKDIAGLRQHLEGPCA